MNPGFMYRVMVALADRARSTTAIGALADTFTENARKSVARSGFLDVDDAALKLIAQLKTAKDVDALLLKAFWLEHVGGFSVHPSSSRLLINPPAGLKIDAIGTLADPCILGGTYGIKVDKNPAPLQQLATAAKFDEVMVFFDAGVEGIARLVEPGSTLVTVSPKPDINSFWLSWAGFDPQFSAIKAELGLSFALRLLHTQPGLDVVTSIYGLTAR